MTKLSTLLVKLNRKQNCSFWTHPNIDLEEDILDEAKVIYDQRSQTDENYDMRERIEKMEKKLDKLETMEKKQEKREKKEENREKKQE